MFMKNVFYIISWFFNTIMLVLSEKFFLFTVKHLNIRVTRKFWLMKIQKQGFQTWKNSKKPQKYNNVFQKNIPECFSIKTIDPICFMKMLWSITANWYFQINIGSGMVFAWSDTPQSTEYCSMQWSAVNRDLIQG